MNKSQKGYSILVLLLILLAVWVIGITGWLVYNRQNNARTTPAQQSESEKTQDVSVQPAPSLKRECPDEWIENRMPRSVGDTGPDQYFIFKGERKELKDYDVEWIQSNCSVKSQPVY